MSFFSFLGERVGQPALIGSFTGSLPLLLMADKVFSSSFFVFRCNEKVSYLLEVEGEK